MMMDLPTPLIMDILSRLPCKTLLRSRCVSKSWKYLIDDTHFISLQLKRSMENTTNHTLLLRDCYIYSVDFPKLDEAVVIDHPLKSYSIGTDLVGSCNGLLCLSNGEGKQMNGTIIYNPTTRKRWELPVSRFKFPENAFCVERTVYGFGYALGSDDYRVVRIIQFFNSYPDFYESEVKVFSLKTLSWRRVQDFPHECYLTFKRQRGIYVNGCLHWIVTFKPESDGSKQILAFDMDSEDYKVVPLPKYSPGEVHLNVEVFQQLLCLLVNYPTIRSEVWVMKVYGIEESWTKLFAIVQDDVIGPFGYVRPLAYSKDGSKVLIEPDLGKLIWFDVERQKVETVKIRNMPTNPEITVFVESLVFGSSKTHQRNKRSNERKRLENANITAMPNSSAVISGGPLDDVHNDTRNSDKDQQTLNGNHNPRKKGQRDNMGGFLSKGFKLKL